MAMLDQRRAGAWALLVALLLAICVPDRLAAQEWPDVDTVQALIVDRAAAHGIDPAALLCTINRESRFQPTARGGLGERGVAQWLGGLGDGNAWDQTSAARQGIDIRRLYVPDPANPRRYLPTSPDSVYFDVDGQAELFARGAAVRRLHWGSTYCERWP